MAYWKQTRYESKPVITSFDGINTGLQGFDIGEGELTYARNTDSFEYPAIATRPGRTTFAETLTAPFALGQRNNEYMHVADGNTWKYWDTATAAYIEVTTTLTSTGGDFAEFVTGTNRYTIYMNANEKLIWDGSSTALVLGDSTTPDTKIFTVHKGRIYAATGSSVKYTALNLPNDWSTVNDSGTIYITNAKGDISGLFEYNDHVIAFTEFSMHELYGSGPSNYELVDVEGEVGCISDKSLIKANKRLYWMAYDGVYEYNGSIPQKISDPVKDYIEKINFTHKDKIVAGSIGDYIYFAVPYNSTENNIILKFDSNLRKWHIDTGAYVDFVTIGNVLYGVNTDGEITGIRSTEVDDYGTAIAWEFISKPYNDGAIAEQKVLSELYTVYDLPTGSELTIGYSTNVENNNSSSFTTLATMTASSNIQNTKTNIPITNLQNVNWYRLRFAGTGPCKIHKVQKNIRIKRR